MPAKGTGTPTLHRGKKCVKCQTDEWKPSRGHFICVCCSRRRSRVWKKERDHHDPVGTMWRQARQRAQATGELFVLAPEDIQAVWPADNRCPVLGLPFERGVGYIRDESPTLDRLDHEEGYEPGNIAVISHKANRAKNTLRVHEVEALAAWMRARGLH